MKKSIRYIAVTMLVSVLLCGCGGAEATADPEGEKTIAIETPASYNKEKTKDEYSVGAVDSAEISKEDGTNDIGYGDVSDKDSVIKDNTDEATNSNAGNDSSILSDDNSGNSTDTQSEKLDYIDLTEMSSTMVYSQVYNMVFYPERFIGTKVKMEGIYSDYFDMAKGNHYFGCLIMDATACCAQGIEFQPTDEYSYPDDYPSDGDMVTVEGEFDIYTEDGNQYCTLKNASIIGFTEIQQ
jgi:hypothetical protein